MSSMEHGVWTGSVVACAMHVADNAQWLIVSESVTHSVIVSEDSVVCRTCGKDCLHTKVGTSRSCKHSPGDPK